LTTRLGLTIVFLKTVFYSLSALF